VSRLAVYGGFSDLLGPLAPGQTAKAPFTPSTRSGRTGKNVELYPGTVRAEPVEATNRLQQPARLPQLHPVCALRQAQGEREKGSILPKNRLC